METFFTKVAGVSFENEDGESRQSIIRKCNEGGTVLLEREPDNPHDRYAIAVFARAGWQVKQIGYLNRGMAWKVSQHMQKGRKIRANITEITGGTHKKPTLGVNIGIHFFGLIDSLQRIVPLVIFAIFTYLIWWSISTR